MQEPKIPPNEDDRLKRLYEYDILDTLPEQSYDDIVKLAAHICDVPIALVSLVDIDRQWFKAKYGLEAPQTSRAISFCGHVVESSQPLLVEDATKDKRFEDNPLVLDDPMIRFYTGIPLQTSDELTLGTLCVIDQKPKKLDSHQLSMLKTLARLVVDQMALRLELKRSQKLQKSVVIAESNAQTIKNRFANFFELSLELLCIASTDGYFQELNPAWTNTLGFSQEELMSKPFIEFVHPEDKEATIKEAAFLMEGGVTVHFTNRYQTKDGGWRWLSWTAVFDSEEQILLAIARDITEQRKYQTNLEKARELAVAADRTKSQFLATMSHELRTPLNSVIGFSNLLSKNKVGNLSETDIKYVSRIRDNGTHLLNLINEILDLSKIEAGQMTYKRELCQASSMIGSVIKLQESLVKEKSLLLHSEIPDNLCSFYADQHRLRQVLMNLISNAIKFTQKGYVQLKVCTHPQTNQIAAIEVRDTGIGIPKSELDTIFQPFRQVDGKTSRAHSGTGLGLAISNSLCEGMGMSLEVESELDMGSTFRIVIPASLNKLNTETNELKESLPSNTISNKRKHRVLIVDDSPDARQLLKESLKELHCDVQTADDGDRCLELALSWKPDLITLDLMMPKRNGWQILSAIKENPMLAHIPVVVVSMVADEAKSTLCDAVEVLNKPVSREQLLPILKKLPIHHKKVLIVDDNQDERVILSSYLKEEGWDVLEALNGQHGIVAVEESKPDIVFLDLMMPVMGGFEFLNRIRTNPNHKELPIVVVTAKDLTEQESQVLTQNANSVIRKGPNLLEQLSTIVTSLEN